MTTYQVFKKEDINNIAKENRMRAYKQTDAIFFKVQRGEASNDEWILAVAAIKEKFKYATEDQYIET